MEWKGNDVHTRAQWGFCSKTSKDAPTSVSNAQCEQLCKTEAAMVEGCSSDPKGSQKACLEQVRKQNMQQV